MEWDATFKEFVYGYDNAEEWLKSEGFDEEDYKFLRAKEADYNAETGDTLYKVEGYTDLMTLADIHQNIGGHLLICYATDDGPELMGIAVIY